ncbi:MAG: hypothetical protein Fur0018_11440 [Anaerolineales bacterium]
MSHALQFTAEDVKRTLQAMSTGNPLPLTLCDLHTLQDIGVESSARRDGVQALLSDTIQAHYNAQRQTVHLPPLNFDFPLTREQILECLAEDFRCRQVSLEAWSALYYRFIAPFPLSVEELAAAVGYHPRQFRRRVERGIELLTRVLHQDELAWQRQARRNALRRYMPPREGGHLFGVAEHIEKLLSLLRDPHQAPIVSVEGLGGIGKTALVQAVIERVADDLPLAGILWVSARTNWLDLHGELYADSMSARSLHDVLSRLASQLKVEGTEGLGIDALVTHICRLLRSAPYMVVVDNLETIQDVQSLAPMLASCSGISRFLLTTRHSVADFPFVRRFPLPELPRQAAWELFSSELAEHGTRTLPGRVADFDRLYAIVGGLPLALKLTAAQLAYLPLTTVLDDLRQGATPLQANLYTFIYRRTWMLLDDKSRRLLLSMLWVSPDGEDADWLQTMSGLPARSFHGALRQLQSFSLLELTGSLSNPLYHLHRLTHTFLRTEILQQWEVSDDRRGDTA